MILLGLVAQEDINAQNAIDASGGFIKNSNYSASYAIGEIQTITLKSGSPQRYATSGVIQPDPLIITLTANPLKRSFKLYPNPVKDVLKIECEESTSIHYKLYDLHGWILLKGPLQDRELKLETLSPGVYMIEFYGISMRASEGYLITKI
jgi:Secretion system C-terminal sorting domain